LYTMHSSRFYYFAFTYRFFFMEERLQGESLGASVSDSMVR